jgi:hypothetical protein
MNEFNLIVWYRYMSNGEQEKDFKDFTIVAETLERAKEIAIESFRMRSAIPFKVELI